MRPINEDPRSAAALNACRSVVPGPTEARLLTVTIEPAALHDLPYKCARQQNSCLTRIAAALRCQKSRRSFDVAAKRHSRRVESYLQRRRHRPWRHRGS